MTISAGPRTLESTPPFHALASLRLTPDQAPPGRPLTVPVASAYQANGARLGWLIIPHQQAVEVWHSNGDPKPLEGLAVLEAGQRSPGSIAAAHALLEIELTSIHILWRIGS